MDADQAHDLARQATTLRKIGAAHVASAIEAYLHSEGFDTDGETVHVLPPPSMIDDGLTPADLWQAHRVILRLRDTGIGDDGQLALDLATETARRLSDPANLAECPLPHGYTPVLPGHEIDRLIRDNLDFARIVVHKTWTPMMLTAGVDRGDALGLANLGLVEAARRYDPATGYKFRTFAYSRIRGAIIDGVRESQWAKRQNANVSARSAVMNAAMRRMESLDAALPGADDGGAPMTRGETIADPADPYMDLVTSDEARQLLDMLLAAPRGANAERDSSILYRRFVDSEPLNKIGADYGVTESRVCQIVARYTTEVRDRYLRAERSQ